MEQKTLAKRLKSAVAVTAIIGIIVFGVCIPSFGCDLVAEGKEFESWYWPWLIFTWVASIPCFGVLVLGWRVASSIGKDQSFCVENAKRMKLASILAELDALFVFIVNVVYYLLGMNHPGVFIAFIFVELAGIVFAVGMAVLSHLVGKASKLQEENDLTI